MRVFRWIAACSCSALLLAGMSSGHAELTPEWEVRFGSTGRVAVDTEQLPHLVRGTAVDALYVHGFGRYPLAPIAAKLDAAGTVAWTVLERSSVAGEPQRLVTLADGSIVTLNASITRYAPDGTIMWVSPLIEQWNGVPTVVEVGDDLVLVAPGTRFPLTRIDRLTGLTLERLAVDESQPVCQDAAVATGADALYWSSACESWDAVSLYKVRLNPLRIEWTTSMDLGDTGRVVSLAADGTGVYVSTRVGPDRSLTKFSPGNGTPLWSVSGNYGEQPEVTLDVDGDPLLSGGSLVDKLDRSSGSMRWRHTSTGVISSIAVSADAIVVAGNASSEVPTALPGFVERVARTDGANLWRLPLAAAAGSTTLVTDIALQGDRLLVTGIECASQAQPKRCDVKVWPRSIGGQGNGSMIPLFTLPPFGRAAVGSGGTITAAAIEWGPSGQQLRVKHLRDIDGFPLWESVVPLLPSGLPGTDVYEINVAVGGSPADGVAVFYGKSPRQYERASSAAFVAKFSGASGTLLWHRSLLDQSAGYTDIQAYDLALDSTGNVVASMHESEIVGWPSPSPNRRQIRKYAATTGIELLRVDFPFDPGWTGSYYYPPRLLVVGEGLYTNGAPLPGNAYGLTHLRGDSGAVVWNVPTLDFPDLLPDHNPAPYLTESAAQLAIVHFDLGTGAELWRTPYAHANDIGYGVWSTFVASDSGVYAGGYRKIPRPGGSPTAWDARGILMRLDPASGNLLWVNRFDQSPVLSSSGELLPVFDHDDAIFSLQHQRPSLDSDGAFLTAVAKSDGTALGTQVLNLSSFLRASEVARSINVLGRSSDGSILTSGGYRNGGAPSEFSVAKLTLPGQFTGGSVRVNLLTAVSRESEDVVVSFVFDTTNDGNIRAPDVDAILRFPYQSILESVRCSHGGTACDAVGSPTSIGRRVDIDPGASIRISGTVRYRPIEDDPRLEASALAPYGFVEMDMKDNVASVRLQRVIFSSGFD